MRLLIDASPQSIVTHIGRDAYALHCGGFITPRSGRDPGHFDNMVWGMDNDCFRGFNRDNYLATLKRWQGRRGCLFVTVPDVVGNAAATMQRFTLWRPAVSYYGYPVALVAQDGLQNMTIQWCKFEALFIGGTTEWKLSQATAELVREAKRRGKWIHMGRVNSNNRLQYARAIGCDSVDGSSYAIIKYKTRQAIPALQRYNLPLWEGLCV